MSEIILSPIQQRLKQEIVSNYNIVMQYINTDRDTSEQFDRMGEAAHKLHVSLDPMPAHHRKLVENRGLQPEHPDFYFQIHCVQDLLAYLNDANANNDPEDITLGDEFHFTVFSRRWGHNDRYSVKRNDKGWLISHSSYHGQGDRYAEPILPEILTHDSISYPRDITYLMANIWERAQDEGLDHEEVQSLIDQVSQWVSDCERSRPNI